MTPEEARALTHQVVYHLDMAKGYLVMAFEGRAWEALNYPTWNDYCRVEIRPHMQVLSLEQRREAVKEMREAKMSTRAIGSALGVDKQTVLNDLRSAPVENSTPERVKGLDGKQYADTKPAPSPDEVHETVYGPADEDEDNPELKARAYKDALALVRKDRAYAGALHWALADALWDTRNE
jgi:hypothetical protein